MTKEQDMILLQCQGASLMSTIALTAEGVPEYSTHYIAPLYVYVNEGDKKRGLSHNCYLNESEIHSKGFFHNFTIQCSTTNLRRGRLPIVVSIS
jgi:hypothetical protein